MASIALEPACPDTTRRTFGLLAACGYVAVVVLANVLSSHYGMVPMGFGLVASAGTYCAGFALGLRDLVQDGLGKVGVLGVIAVAALLSLLLATPAIAVASLVAFVLAELCDLLIYTPLRHRGWARAVIFSNVVGAVVDTVVFLHLAHFGTDLRSIGGQLVGKLLWATLLPVALVVLGREARKRTA